MGHLFSIDDILYEAFDKRDVGKPNGDSVRRIGTLEESDQDCPVWQTPDEGEYKRIGDRNNRYDTYAFNAAGKIGVFRVIP